MKESIIADYSGEFGEYSKFKKYVRPIYNKCHLAMDSNDSQHAALHTRRNEV